MFNHSIRKMFAVALVSVPVIWFGGTYTAQAQEADLEFELINDTDRDIIEFYVSPTESDNYGDDILGVDVLPAGESSNITISNPSTCRYDLWAKLGEGEGVGVGELYQTNVNICETTEYRYGYN